MVLYQRPSGVLLADSYGLARAEWGISTFYSELGTRKRGTVLPHAQYNSWRGCALSVAMPQALRRRLYRAFA
ncbi:hypothetical protein [Nostoc sp.]|uniref:hypothetical protein n=1 Tax=Nostoc sp. TaxID=1180 RepID=UPI003006E88B